MRRELGWVDEDGEDCEVVRGQRMFHFQNHDIAILYKPQSILRVEISMEWSILTERKMPIVQRAHRRNEPNTFLLIESLLPPIPIRLDCRKYRNIRIREIRLRSRR